MATYSETILQRYKAVEEERDTFGRIIKVQRLRPFDDATMRKIAGTEVVGVLSVMAVAACVREIVDEEGKSKLFAPPRSEADIAIVMNALDEEGIAAALKAYARLRGIDLDGDGEPTEDVVDAAKN